MTCVDVLVRMRIVTRRQSRDPITATVYKTTTDAAWLFMQVWTNNKLKFQAVTEKIATNFIECFAVPRATNFVCHQHDKFLTERRGAKSVSTVKCELWRHAGPRRCIQVTGDAVDRLRRVLSVGYLCRANSAVVGWIVGGGGSYNFRNTAGCQLQIKNIIGARSFNLVTEFPKWRLFSGKFGIFGRSLSGKKHIFRQPRIYGGAEFALHPAKMP